jgi:metal-sulfur cluster biosynthetic enzyme
LADAASFTEADLLDALAECYVPALRRDVVAAGLVRRSTVAADSEAPGAGIAGVPTRYRVTLDLSAPGGDDAVNAQTRAAVENRLLGLPQISRVAITMHPALFPILSGR